MNFIALLLSTSCVGEPLDVAAKFRPVVCAEWKFCIIDSVGCLQVFGTVQSIDCIERFIKNNPDPWNEMTNRSLNVLFY